MTAILNKKVILAVAMIVAVVAVAMGATYAAWQASDYIADNEVTTATLAIDAVGAAAFGSDEKPVFETNVLPGHKGLPVDRAEITNNSSVPLDLWFYITDVVGTPGACDATKIAWRASTPGNGANWKGYGTAIDGTTYENTSVVGNITDTGSTTAGTFTLINQFVGVGNAVKIANATSTNPALGFGPGQKIAMRQIAGFAQDASYPTHSGTCTWTEVFVGTLPGQLPVNVVIPPTPPVVTPLPPAS